MTSYRLALYAGLSWAAGLFLVLLDTLRRRWKKG